MSHVQSGHGNRNRGNETNKHGLPLITADLPLSLLSAQISKTEGNTEPLFGTISWKYQPSRLIMLDHFIMEGAGICLHGNNYIYWRVISLSCAWCFCPHYHMWFIGCLIHPHVSHTALSLIKELIYTETAVVLGSHHRIHCSYLEAARLMEWWNVLLKAHLWSLLGDNISWSWGAVL